MASYTFTKPNRHPYLSPLRYPGGKAVLYPFLRDLVDLNCGNSPVYCEPYAGGAGGALELLLNGHVDEIKLNDRDYHIFAFWNILLNDTAWLIDQIEVVKVNLREWEKQRSVYDNFRRHSRREVAFSTFFLNRCNRGGILPNAGPIGGKDQKGAYPIDARFNRDGLVERILKVAEYREQIRFVNEDAYDFITTCFKLYRNSRLLMYVDPPYYKQGAGLYLNSYKHLDHENIAGLLKSKRQRNWFLSYDNEKPILELYQGVNKLYFDLQYSLQRVAVAKEIMVFSDALVVPNAVSRMFLS
ncbi:MAG: DNA adenine methylase [Flavobacteriales bacterium]|nr:DNA adenine methylase [Flavobacteriales bacterium]